MGSRSACHFLPRDMALCPSPAREVHCLRQSRGWTLQGWTLLLLPLTRVQCAQHLHRPRHSPSGTTEFTGHGRAPGASPNLAQPVVSGKGVPLCLTLSPGPASISCGPRAPAASIPFPRGTQRGPHTHGRACLCPPPPPRKPNSFPRHIHFFAILIGPLAPCARHCSRTRGHRSK